MADQALLIRCRQVDDDVLRQARRFASFFKDHIFFVCDAYGDPNRPPVTLDGSTLTIGRKFLWQMGVSRFRKAGWQFGDLAYCAAATLMPDFDLFWMIEPDVHFGLDPDNFFAVFNDVAVDYLAPYLSIRHAGWRWHASMAPYVPTVYGAPFPFTRLSKRAIAHLKASRRSYFGLPSVAAALARQASMQIANDECFVASILMRDGFVCADMLEFYPAPFRGYFSTGVPIHRDELPFLEGRIVHPVCDTVRTNAKLRGLISSHPERALRRMEEMRQRIGSDVFASCCDISIEEVAILARKDQPE